MTQESKEAEVYENGDLFDNDNGEYYGRLTDGAGDEIKAPPANLTMYYNGFWYNFKLDSREDATRAADPQDLNLMAQVDIGEFKS